MGYDEQSQMWGGSGSIAPNCTARPNSPLKQTFDGVRQYLNLGLPRSKLVLGVPWYGYMYPCQSRGPEGQCRIKSVPFRGCPCSDAAGGEKPFKEVMELLETAENGSKWDRDSQTPYFDFRGSGEKDYQVWYDDPRSLGIKYGIARDMGLRGVGMWAANFLDYANRTQVGEMWGAIP